MKVRSSEKPLFLGNAAALRKKIAYVTAKAAGRRIVLVAYVGDNGVSFLTEPDGVTVYCWDAPGSTTAAGIESLQARGATVYFVAGLHAKLYWSKRRGCVVASANLSMAALNGSSVRHEIGVYFPDSAIIDIGKIIHRLRARPATKDAIARLDREAPAVRRARASLRRKRRLPPFEQWARAPARRVLVVIWSSEGKPTLGDYAAIAESGEAIGIQEARDRYRDSVWAPNSVGVGDWLLTVKATASERLVGPTGWLYVHAVGRVEGERWAYELSSRPTPPFAASAAFSLRVRRFLNTSKRRQQVARRGYFVLTRSCRQALLAVTPSPS